MLDHRLTLSQRFGGESGNNEVIAWAQEPCAGSSLPRGDYRGVLAATNVGAAPRPEPKPGPDRRGPPDRSRHWSWPGTAGADALPEKLDNHSGVDPAGRDTCSIDCYGS